MERWWFVTNISFKDYSATAQNSQLTSQPKCWIACPHINQTIIPKYSGRFTNKRCKFFQSDPNLMKDERDNKSLLHCQGLSCGPYAPKPIRYQVSYPGWSILHLYKNQNKKIIIQGNADLQTSSVESIYFKLTLKCGRVVFGWENWIIMNQVVVQTT